MAAATSKLNLNAFPYGSTVDQAQQILYGVCQLSAGGTYSTNGVPVSWTFFNPDGTVFTPLFSSAQNDPIVAYFTSGVGGVLSQQGTPALQSYIYDSVHNTLRIWGGSVELTNGLAITVDTILFEAHFAKYI